VNTQKSEARGPELREASIPGLLTRSERFFSPSPAARRRPHIRPANPTPRPQNLQSPPAAPLQAHAENLVAIRSRQQTECTPSDSTWSSQR